MAEKAFYGLDCSAAQRRQNKTVQTSSDFRCQPYNYQTFSKTLILQYKLGGEEGANKEKSTSIFAYNLSKVRVQTEVIAVTRETESYFSLLESD